MGIEFYKTEHEANWHDKLNEAIKFYSTTDKYLPPSNTSLHLWLSTQYSKYIKGELSLERSNYLTTYIPNFEKVLNEYKNSRRVLVSFDERLEEFKKYVKENNTPLVPVNTNLGSWVNAMRKSYLYGKLSQEKINKLQDAGFVFNVDEYQWNLKYEKLCRYYKIHGHCNISTSDEDFGDLYKWLGHQRIAYKENQLLIKRQEKLEAIGVEWNMFDFKWEAKYLKLCKFYDKYKTCNVTKEYKEYYDDLNSWIITQRKQYKKGILYLDRIEKLNRINFIWDYNEYIWDKKCDAARYYLKKYPGKTLPKKAKYNLYEWFKYNEALYSTNKLDENKVRRMKSLLELKECA